MNIYDFHINILRDIIKLAPYDIFLKFYNREMLFIIENFSKAYEVLNDIDKLKVADVIFKMNADMRELNIADDYTTTVDEKLEFMLKYMIFLDKVNAKTKEQ